MTKRRYFGTDGIRGEANKHPMSAEVALRVGLAAGKMFRTESGRRHLVVIGKETFPRKLSLNGLRVVVDCANGAAYKVAPLALYELGAEVKAIGVSPDGFNINDECGSTYPEAMARAVREYRADIGIALDGD